MSRNVTWNNQGVDVTNSTNIDEVLKTSKLDYMVVKAPLQYNIGNKSYDVPKKVMTLKAEKPMETFGIVSPDYNICQNKEAFDFINYVDEDIKFIKAGETKSGIVYIISQLPEINVLGDTISPHIIFQNGHNGFITIKANMCMLRLICQNQFNGSFRDASNVFKIRHNNTMNEKLNTAKETLKETKQYIQSYKDMANEFSGKHVNDAMLQKIISKMILDNKNLDELEDKRGKLEEKVNNFKQVYNADDNQNFKGTAWGVINAWTDFATHTVAPKKSNTFEERRFISNTFESKKVDNLIQILEEI